MKMEIRSILFVLPVVFMAVTAATVSAQQYPYSQPQNSWPTTQNFQSQSFGTHWTQQLAPNRQHDFGTVPSYSNQEFVFEFENIFETPVYLTGIRTSCGCTQPSIQTNTVEPGGTGRVLARFDTKNHQGAKRATVTVSVRRDRPHTEYGEIQFQVSGNIRRDVVLNPGTVSFDNVLSGDVVKRAVEILYAGNPQWQIMDIKSTNPNVSVSINEKQRNAQTKRVDYELTILLDEKQPVGTFSDQLYITTNDVNNKNLSINIFGNVKSVVQVSPIRCVVTQNDNVKKKLILRGDRPFGIKSVSTGDQRIKFSPATGSKTLHILYYSVDTSMTGQITSNITIETDDPDQRLTTVSFEAQIVPSTFAVDDQPE